MYFILKRLSNFTRILSTLWVKSKCNCSKKTIVPVLRVKLNSDASHALKKKSFFCTLKQRKYDYIQHGKLPSFKHKKIKSTYWKYFYFILILEETVCTSISLNFFNIVGRRRLWSVRAIKPISPQPSHATCLKNETQPNNFNKYWNLNQLSF